jgi:uncharacterized protein
MSNVFVSLIIAALAVVGGIAAKTFQTKTATSTPVAQEDAEYKRAVASIGNRTFDILVSDTETLRQKGLSGRNDLKNNQAMLFVFDQPESAGFWMKDMKFSIDILWLDDDFRVVTIKNNLSSDTYPNIFFPSKPSRYVIELAAGTLESLGIKEGDTITVSGGK